MGASTGRPLPDWTGGAPRLVVHCCDRCRATWYLPRQHCPECGSAASTPVEAAGTGLCVAATRVHVPSDGDEPVDLVLVELDEGPVVMARSSAEQLRRPGPGDRLRVGFRTVADALLPYAASER